MNTRTIVRASAWYDLIVSVGFATPWTARAVLALLGDSHRAVGAGGTPLDALPAPALMFVAFFGTVVTLWSIVRIADPSPRNGRIDTLGRIAFSAWMAWALANGASHLLIGFLVLEVGWAVVQGVATWRK